MSARIAVWLIQTFPATTSLKKRLNCLVTTKIPNLGVLRVDEERDIIIADIPGILEGASEGVGLGIRFLKHISRSAGLAFLIDLSEDNYLQAYGILCKELESYSAELSEKKRIIVATKLDLPDTKERFQKLQEALPEHKVLGISLFNKWGLGEVKDAFIALADDVQKKNKKEELSDPYAPNKNFMEADLDDTVYDDAVYQEEDGNFGATVSLSRKRKPKK